MPTDSVANSKGTILSSVICSPSAVYSIEINLQNINPPTIYPAVQSANNKLPWPIPSKAQT